MSSVSQENYKNYEDEDLLDFYLSWTRRKELLKDESDTDIAYYDEHIQAIVDEYVSRGYSEDDLTADAESREAMIMSADEADLKSYQVNLRYLCDYNDVEHAELVAKYLDMTPFERETTVCFKTELEGPVLGVEKGDRWDENLSEDGTVVMNEGTKYEVVVSQNEDGTYHCESEYLGSFDYDSNIFAIGYKEVEGEDELKLPVLKCLPDASGVQEGPGYGDAMMGVGLESFDSAYMEKTRMRPDDFYAYQEVVIPEGVKVLDYTFEDIDNLNFIPYLPDSVESAHCAFKGCEKLWQESEAALEDWKIELGDTRKMHWPPNLQDMSSMFSGCGQLHDLKFCDFPSEVRTIDNMFDGCPSLFEGVDMSFWKNGPVSLLPWAGKTDGIFQGTFLSTANEIDWSNCPYLLEEFSYCVNSETSNTFKKVAEREEAERQVFQEEYSSEENQAELSEEEKDAYDKAQAANTARKTEKVLDADMTVRDVNDLSLNLPETNELLAFVQRAAIDVGSFSLIKGVTKGVTGSKFAGWIAGLAGTYFLDSTDILPESFEPILQAVKGMLPESAQETMDKVIDFFFFFSKADYEAAEAERFDRYVPLALEDSMKRSLDSAGGVKVESLREAMRVNGEVIGANGVALYVGEHGLDSASSVATIVKGSTSAAEDVFDERLAAGEDCNDLMHDYYMSVFEGLDGYNEGVKQGIVSAYDKGEETTDKDRANMEKALYGLEYINVQYCEEAWRSLKEYDDKYHFMTEEDYEKLASYGFVLEDSYVVKDAEQVMEQTENESVSTEDVSSEKSSEETEPTTEVGSDDNSAKHEKFASKAQDLHDKIFGDILEEDTELDYQP